MTMKLTDQVSSICSREDFVSFVNALSQDYHNNPETWENRDPGKFLEALAGWVEDMDGYYRNQGRPVPDKVDWKAMAEMLIAAKMYE